MTVMTAPIAAARPEGPPKLTAAQLRRAQEATLDTPRLRYGLLTKALLTFMDLAYGRAGTLVKFAMLEVIARVPYQAWERIGYRALTRFHRRRGAARRIFDRIVATRAEQDNEQWHLLILQDLIDRDGLRQSVLRHKVMPWLVSLVYYHISWLLFLIRPEWSYRLNAEFEDHAEHSYMLYVADHPELETEPDPGSYASEYGRYDSVADLLRQIGHDERQHKLDSMACIPAARFQDTRYPA